MNLRNSYLSARSALARLRATIVSPRTSPTGTMIATDFDAGMVIGDELGIAEYFEIRDNGAGVPFRREGAHLWPQEFADDSLAEVAPDEAFADLGFASPWWPRGGGALDATGDEMLEAVRYDHFDEPRRTDREGPT